MVEDDAKVAAYLRQLNSSETGKWFAAEGFYIWGAFVFGRGGQSNTVKAGEGVVVKVFINNRTGEIKTVLAQAMVRDA